MSHNSHIPFFSKVIWRHLYSTSSARDIGTIYQARNAINATEGVNCRLQVAGAGCRLQVAGCRCRCRLQVAGCRCRLQVAGCRLQVAIIFFFKQKMYDLYMVRFYLNFFKKIRIVSFVKKPW